MRATAFTAALMALFTTMAVCGTSAGPATRRADDRDRIQGTWGFGSVIDQGKEQPMPKENRVVITSDTLKIVYPKDDPMGWRYTIDPTKSPKEMDWIVEIDPGHPIRQLAIYTLDGDTLKICSAAAGNPRPTTFESRKGDFGGLWILKRAAPPATTQVANK
jgi:uncharacterized protein (TIGR03067 family)